ncbi:hypothetical protein FKW77_010706 [Venturia effusa]|uniref:Uncharacterized protein n=1 Tax=Venturia effusa TaxID=50376 RepID=A0A517KY97_9PEZI|nr:hypothetical protein FKW77_010706 [Venturia effusa]
MAFSDRKYKDTSTETIVTEPPPATAPRIAGNNTHHDDDTVTKAPPGYPPRHQTSHHPRPLRLLRRSMPLQPDVPGLSLPERALRLFCVPDGGASASETTDSETAGSKNDCDHCGVESESAAVFLYWRARESMTLD